MVRSVDWAVWTSWNDEDAGKEAVRRIWKNRTK